MQRSPPPDLSPCHTAVVFALSLEAGAFEDRLSGLLTIHGANSSVRQGGLGGRSVVVIRSGPGAENAARATAALIAGHRPKWVISAGLAGGLAADLNRCDLVAPESVIDEHGSQITVSVPATQALIRCGALLTVDRVVSTADEKRDLRQRFGAACVDMESFAVARACRREGKTQFLAIRAISDTVDEDLPRDVERLLRKKSAARRLGAAAGSIIRRPAMLKDLWRLKETAIECSTKLAIALERLIGDLP